MNLKKISILGIHYHQVTIGDIHEFILNNISNKNQVVIANHNLHSIYLYKKNTYMKRFIDQAEIIHADGMPLIFWSRLMGHNVDRHHRITYVDWIYPLMKFCRENNLRVFFLGSKPGVANTGAQILRDRFPGLEIETHHGFFDASKNSFENSEIINGINSFNADILMVGMGMPRQEKWILKNKKNLNVNVFLCAGACMEYVSGVVTTPPRWIGNIGMEWFYRLIENPKRFGHRYLVEPWYLIPYAWEDIVCKIKRINN